MRYKIVAWESGLVRGIFKTDDPLKVNKITKEYKKLGADKIEVYERGTLERKIYGWTK